MVGCYEPRVTLVCIAAENERGGGVVVITFNFAKRVMIRCYVISDPVGGSTQQHSLQNTLDVLKSDIYILSQ